MMGEGFWKGLSIALAALGGMKALWDYLKRRSDNSTKLKLNNQKSEAISREEITQQYHELLTEFNELKEQFAKQSVQLERALTAFDVLYPFIDELAKEKPEFKAAIHQALKHFNKNKN